ncbi:MAG: class I SAM-dependent methyltransferase [Candidatus Diapherotrites archaeon]
MAHKPVERLPRQRLDVPKDYRPVAAEGLWTHRAIDRRYFTGRQPSRIRRSFTVHSIGEIDLLKRTQMAGGILDYEKELLLRENGISIKKMIERKFRGKRGRLRVLDVGCGFGVFLGQLKKAFPGIEASGLSLSRPLPSAKIRELKAKILEDYSKAHSEVKDWRQMPSDIRERVQKMERENKGYWKRMEKGKLDIRTGMAETYNWGNKKFDLIFSNLSILHAINPVQAIENTLAHLAPEGEAFVNFKVSKAFFEQPEIKSWLEKNRITVECLGEYREIPTYQFVKRK